MPRINMALQGVVRGIRSDFHTGKYSDMRLIDRNGKVYNVHKLVLCHQSPWFENAMKQERFKEGQENTVHLPEDDPRAVAAMLDFLCLEKFNWPSGIGTVEERLHICINIVVLADKYMIRPDDQGLASRVSKDHNLFLERDEFLDDTKKAFPRVLQAVYDQTRATDRWLRGPTVIAALKYLDQLLEDAEFRKVMSETPGFVRELASSQARKIDSLTKAAEAQTEGRPDTYKCSTCKNKITMGLLDAQQASYCPACGTKVTNTTWKKRKISEV